MPKAKRKVARQARDYVLPQEVDRLLEAALSEGRHAHRNSTLILLCFRHGLSLGELTEMQWKQVDFGRKVLKVSRAMRGISSRHPLSGTEIKALRKLKKDYPGSRYLFVSDHGRRLTSRSVSRVISEAGEIAGLKFHVTARMLRRGCGHALAQAGHHIVALQHYMGHRNILKTLRYTELPSEPFKKFWKGYK